MKKEILLTINNTQPGGGPQYLYLICAHSKNDIHIACPTDGIYTDKFRCSIGENKIYNLDFNEFKFSTLIQAWKIIKSKNIKVVHTNSKICSVYFRTIKLFRGKFKLIHTFHGFSLSNLSFKNKIGYLLFENLTRFLVDQFISVSRSDFEESNKWIMGISKKNAIIYNGVESSYNPASSTSKIIVHCTRFDYQKNFEEILSLSTLLPNYVFKVLGTGIKLDYYKSLVKTYNIKNIEFLGYVENVRDIFRSCLIYLSSSRFEGLPFAIIEALSVGLPVVASNVRGNNECISSGHGGLLYELGNISEIIQAVKQIEDNIQSFRDGALNCFMTTFKVEIMIESLDALYES